MACLAVIFTALGGAALFSMGMMKRRRFHGILTDEPADGITIMPHRGIYELAQDVISRCTSPEECARELRKSGDITYLPCGTKMSIRCPGNAPMPVREWLEADEKAMYECLEKLKGCGRTEVVLQKGTDFEIILLFYL